MENKKLFSAKIILIITSFLFGIGKLMVSPENTSDVFGSIGGSTSQYFTGIYQIIEGILLIFPSTAFIGALMVAISMVVAILLHVFVIGFEGPFLVLTIIAIILLFVASYVMKHTRKNLLKRNEK